MDQLISSIKKYTSISPKLENKIIDTFTFEKVAASTTILKSGETSRKKWYIKNGIAKAFFYDENGTEKIVGFHLPDTFMYQTESYNLQLSSKIFIQSIGNMDLLAITKTNEEDLLTYHEYLKFAYYYNLDLQSKTQQIYNQILYQNGEERYNYLLENYPIIIQKAKLKDIASFIGVSQERLSRIRHHIN